jgi:hypothetical protein
VAVGGEMLANVEDEFMLNPMNPCYEVYCYEVLIDYFCYEVLVMKYGEIRYITCKPRGIKEEPISNSDIPVNRMIARSDLNNTMVNGEDLCVYNTWYGTGTYMY